ncbi:MAG: glucose-6-phosphate isomerase, partial [Actinomycetota bacterium]
FGWGPRFLHSTGQFHKGGPLVGSFIQITRSSALEIPIPVAGYGFERLVLAQALGDFEALKMRNLPVMRIHLKDERVGIAELVEAARKLKN